MKSLVFIAYGHCRYYGIQITTQRVRHLFLFYVLHCRQTQRSLFSSKNSWHSKFASENQLRRSWSAYQTMVNRHSPMLEVGKMKHDFMRSDCSFSSAILRFSVCLGKRQFLRGLVKRGRKSIQWCGNVFLQSNFWNNCSRQVQILWNNLFYLLMLNLRDLRRSFVTVQSF